jgi:hypothetical protein
VKNWIDQSIGMIWEKLLNPRVHGDIFIYIYDLCKKGDWPAVFSQRPNATLHTLERKNSKWVVLRWSKISGNHPEILLEHGNIVNNNIYNIAMLKQNFRMISGNLASAKYYPKIFELVYQSEWLVIDIP